MVPKLRGINSCDGGRSVLRHQLWTTGIIMATRPVLFINADTTATGISKRTCATSRLCGFPSTYLTRYRRAVDSSTP